MADAKKDEKKKPVSKAQAQKVAAAMKGQGNGGPAVPTPKDNPVTTGMDDNDGDESQGA
jgi:hypothetical protein